MSKPTTSPPVGQASKAAPREVFFQALTLYRKADRLTDQDRRRLCGGVDQILQKGSCDRRELLARVSDLVKMAAPVPQES
jgi:hypothetical protein